MPKINSSQNQIAAKTLYEMLEFFPKAREATKKRQGSLRELRNRLKAKPAALETESQQVPFKK